MSSTTNHQFERVFILLCFTLCLVGVEGTIWNPDIFPNPKRDTYLCGRNGRKSNICDPDSVLSTRAADRIEGIIQDVQEGMSPYRQDQCGSKGVQGYQIAVAVMKKMKVEHSMDPQGAAREFAKQLHARWGVGMAECDNGVLVLLSVGDRQVYISTGKQSATVLSTDNLNLIISWMIPYLKNKNYDEAVIRAVTNIGLGLSGWELSKDDPAWTSRKRKKRLETCKDVLKRIKEEQDKVQSQEWSQHKTCPVCLEPFHEDDDTDEAQIEDNERQELTATERRRIILQCGHAVCEPCLQAWMEQSRSCPVCRQDVEGNDDDDSRKRSERSEAPSSRIQTMGHALAGDALAADLIYRLRRAQLMYPEYITDDLIDDWNTDTSQTGTFDFGRFSDHQVRHQAIAAAQERSGHFGNATSFGGGGGGASGGAQVAVGNSITPSFIM
eukprot:jgi/Picre1/29153/NNA_004546.t1